MHTAICEEMLGNVGRNKFSEASLQNKMKREEQNKTEQSRKEEKKKRTQPARLAWNSDAKRVS